MNIKSFFESINLSKDDYAVYVALLALADAEASLIAKKAKVKRTTAYQILEKLKEQGLVSSYRSKGKLRFYAESPTKILYSLEEKAHTFKKILPELQSLQDVSRIIPRARVLEGKKGISSVFSEALESKEKMVYTMGSMKELYGASGFSSGRGYTSKRIELKIRSRVLLNLGEKADKEFIDNQSAQLREVRWLPKNFKIPGYFVFWDNKCGFISTKGEGYALLMESKDFTDTMKSLFNFLWEISEKTGNK